MPSVAGKTEDPHQDQRQEIEQRIHQERCQKDRECSNELLPCGTVDCVRKEHDGNRDLNEQFGDHIQGGRSEIPFFNSIDAKHGMPERMRYFCMGNALVVPMITRMGKVLDLIIDKE